MTSPELQMFAISACTTCRNCTCAGVASQQFNPEDCPEYIAWKNLSSSDKLELFVSATIDEITRLEEIVL